MNCREDKELKHKRKREQLGQRILAQARNELYLEMPFLDCALGEFSFQEEKDIRGIGTDGRKIFYNPLQLFLWYQKDEKQLNRRYLHLLFHGIFLHWYQVQRKEPFWWDLACDIAVEFAIDQLKIRKIAGTEGNKREKWYHLMQSECKTLTAEKIEVWLKERCTEEEARGVAEEFVCDDHTMWYPQKRKEQQSECVSRAGKDTGKSAKEQGESENNKKRWAQIGQKVLLNLDIFVKQGGNTARNLKMQIRQANRKKYDYKIFLEKFMRVREQMKIDIDSFDYGLYQYGFLLYQKVPILEPLEYKEEKKLEEFVIVLDTSASCAHGLLEQFLAETMNILEQGNFFGTMCLHLIQCDCKIQEDVCVTDKKSFQEYLDHFEAKGLGGTDFRPAFSYIDRLREKKRLRNLKGMIYFTDGYGVFPKKKPDYEAAFVFLQEEPKEITVPAWAVKILLEAGDLRRDKSEYSRGKKGIDSYSKGIYTKR